jgi:hypothetical protein
MGDILSSYLDSLPEADPLQAINHPQHYGGAENTYEAIKVIEAWELGFCLGNVIKYISRAGKKGNRLEDLEKAKWYLNREIEKQNDLSRNTYAK